MATVAAKRPAMARSGLRWGLVAPVAIALLLIAATTAYMLTRPAVPEESVSAVLYTTALTIDEHATEMSDLGRRLITVGSQQDAAAGTHWVAEGQHLIADAGGLQDLARRLRSTGALLGSHPTRASEVDLGALSGEARILIAEGRRTATHGRAMVELSRSLATLARQERSGIATADVDLLERRAAAMVADGERTERVGQTLGAFVDRMRRSLGR